MASQGQPSRKAPSGLPLLVALQLASDAKQRIDDNAAKWGMIFVQRPNTYGRLLGNIQRRQAIRRTRYSIR